MLSIIATQQCRLDVNIYLDSTTTIGQPWNRSSQSFRT
jgi:hypothetical protein